MDNCSIKYVIDNILSDIRNQIKNTKRYDDSYDNSCDTHNKQDPSTMNLGSNDERKDLI